MQKITTFIKRKKILFIILAIIILGLAALFIFSPNGSEDSNETQYVSAAVEQGTITTSISGSGSLESASSYEVTSDVSAEIDEIKVEEGDTVEEGDVLMTLDGSSVELALEKAKLSYNNAVEEQENIEDELDNLSIASTVTGIITKLSANKYQSIQKGEAVAEVTSDSYMSAKVYLDDLSDLTNFNKGDSISGTTLSGKSFTATVTSVNTTYENVDGTNYYSLTLKIANSAGKFKESTEETITVTKDSRSYTSQHSSSVDYIYNPIEIVAKVSGEISSLSYEAGDRVTKGSTIAKINGDELEDSLANQKITVKEALLSLNDAKKAVNNLSIKAEQDGTISSLSVKEGDTATGTLMKIADYANLNVIISVDELDINDIQIGQKANVTSSLYEDETLSGTISDIAMEGSAQNGVTTFDVMISLDDAKDLKVGMSVDAEIILEESADVVMVPLAAVQKDDEGYFVYKTDQTENITDEVLEQSKQYVQVGISNTAYAEITSGLSVGDVIIYQSQTSSSGDTTQMQNFMTQNGNGTGGDMQNQQRPDSGSMPSGGAPSGE